MRYGISQQTKFTSLMCGLVVDSVLVKSDVPALICVLLKALAYFLCQTKLHFEKSKQVILQNICSVSRPYAAWCSAVFSCSHSIQKRLENILDCKLSNTQRDAQAHTHRLIFSYLSCSLADHWGTTVDFTTSFLHYSWFSAFCSSIFHSRPVTHTYTGIYTQKRSQTHTHSLHLNCWNSSFQKPLQLWWQKLTICCSQFGQQNQCQIVICSSPALPSPFLSLMILPTPIHNIQCSLNWSIHGINQMFLRSWPKLSFSASPLSLSLIHRSTHTYAY